MQSSHLSNFALAPRAHFSNCECPHASNVQTALLDTVLNIVRNVKEHSRMLQRVAIVTSQQKNCKHHFDEFAADSVCKRPSSVADVINVRSPSGTPHFRCNARRAPKNRRGKMRKDEEKAETQS